MKATNGLPCLSPKWKVRTFNCSWRQTHASHEDGWTHPIPVHQSERRLHRSSLRRKTEEGLPSREKRAKIVKLWTQRRRSSRAARSVSGGAECTWVKTAVTRSARREGPVSQYFAILYDRLIDAGPAGGGYHSCSIPWKDNYQSLYAAECSVSRLKG